MKTAACIEPMCSPSGVREWIAGFLAFFCISVFLSSAHAQTESAVRNSAFGRGERLVYKIYYHSILTGSVIAGDAMLEVTKENKQIAGKNTYHMVAAGRTRGAFNLFYKVIDRFESYIDEETLLPYLFLRRIYEDGYVRDQDNIFDRKNNVVLFKDNLKGSTEKITVPAGTHDIVSAVYYLRNFNYSGIGEGETIPLQYVFADSVYTSEIRILGRDVINIGVGRIACLKVQPRVLTGNVFSENYPLTIWVTDDENRIPVFAQSDILVGSVRMELVSWKDIQKPLVLLKK